MRLGIAVKPAGVAWRDIIGVGILGGIGFTISLFVTELAFAHGPLADAARVGILAGSLIAGTIGYFALREVLPPPREDDQT